MSREILFRGKRVDNGKWVYGCFINSVVRNGVFGYITGNKVVEPIKILRKTLGQYTGYNDIKGNKIYEGDIVKHHIHTRGYEHLDKNYFVDFSCGEYVLKTDLENEDCEFIENNYVAWDRCEIVGNIYDNKELL